MPSVWNGVSSKGKGFLYHDLNKVGVVLSGIITPLHCVNNLQLSTIVALIQAQPEMIAAVKQGSQEIKGR